MWFSWHIKTHTVTHNQNPIQKALYYVSLMVSCNGNIALGGEKKKDSIEISVLQCLSHYIHFLLQQRPTQKPRTLAIYWCNRPFLRLSLWPCPIVPAAAQAQGRYIQCEPDGAALLEESHCFNYSHIITPINCHVFVNAQEKKKR